jgi:two-component system, OmpR family, sensor kinase
MRTARAVSLRVRLTLAFGVSMTVVLAGLAVFLYVRLGAELQRSVDMELRSRAATIAAALRDRGPVPVNSGSSVIDPDEAFAQVLDPAGRIVDSSRAVRSAPMVAGTTLASITGPTFVTRRVAGVADQSRLLVDPVHVGGRTLLVVVGSNLGDENEALDRLLLLLAIGIPTAILLACGAGWLVATAALRPLDAALDAERRLIDEASHDLRTPLGVLKAELDLALMRPRTAAEMEGTLRTAAEQTDELVRLAEDLLVHARSRRGHMPVRRESVELRSFCDDCAASFRTRGEQVVVEAESRSVSVDPVLLRQAVRNLLDNAFAHGMGQQVTLLAVVADGRIRITVRDGGPGFPPRRRRRLGRADRAESGLGLSIVAAVAEGHGGFITSGAASPGGAFVTIDIPACASLC